MQAIHCHKLYKHGQKCNMDWINFLVVNVVWILRMHYYEIYCVWCIWQKLKQDKGLMICVCLTGCECMCVCVSVCLTSKRVQFIRKLSVKHTLLNYFTTLIVVLVLTSQFILPAFLMEVPQLYGEAIRIIIHSDILRKENSNQPQSMRF